MYAYRRATPEDIDALTEMRVAMLCEETDYKEEFQSTLRKNTSEYVKNSMADASFSAWVAVSDEKIVAMGGAAFFRLPPNDWCPGGKTAYIGNLYTLPEYRKQGIASHLLSRIIEEAKARGCERILLHATELGRPLYEKAGFEHSDTAMALYPFGIAAEG